MRWICYIPFVIFLSGFGGKVPPPKEVIRVFQADSPIRTLTFITFDNETGDSHKDYLKNDIPKQLYRSLNKFNKIEVSPDELFLEWKNEDKYHIISISNDNLSTNKIISFSNSIDYWTTNKSIQVHFIKTNHIQSNLFIQYLYISDKSKYIIDARSKYFNEKELLPFEELRTTNNIKYLFVETNDYKRQLVVKNQIYTTRSLSLSEIISKLSNNNSHYAVYGKIDATNTGEFSLKIYLLLPFRNEIKLVFQQVIYPESTFEQLSILPQLIFSYIQRKEMITDIHFDSTPTEAYIYIQNNFMGKTPLTISSYPIGKYDFSIWHPLGDIDLKDLDTNNFIIGRKYLKEKTPKYSTNYYKEDIVSISLSPSLSNKTNFFIVNVNADRGFVNLISKNESNVILHIDAILEGIIPLTYNTGLPIGKHFFYISKTNFEPIKIFAPILKNTTTHISYILQPIKPPSVFTSLFLNFNRNTKVFASISGTLAAISIGAYFIKLDSDLKSKSSSGQAREYYDNIRYEQNQIIIGLLAGTLSSLLATLFSRILEIHENRTKIELGLKSSKYIKINFETHFD